MSEITARNTWVEIHNIILDKEERSARVPDDTKEMPLEMKAKGFLTHDAALDEEVEIITLTGRKLKGKLIRINPAYVHQFGHPIPELSPIGMELRDILKEGSQA